MPNSNKSPQQEERVYSVNLETLYPKWWEYICLWFIKGEVIRDGTRAWLLKRWRGKIYFMKEYYV